MVDEVPLEHQLIFPPLPMLETKGREGCCDFLSLARWRTSKVLPVWCCGSLGTPSLSPNRAQGLSPPLQPSLLFAAPTSHTTGRCFGDVTPPQQAPSPGLPGRNLGAVELRGDTASPEERAVEWPAPNPPLAGHTLGPQSKQLPWPGCEPGRENTPSPQKSFIPL